MEISAIIANADGLLLTGMQASTALKILRVADGYLLDWSDLTFKAAGWGSLTTPLIEADAANLPGLYKKGVTVTAWTNGSYHFLLHYDDGTTVLNLSGEQYIQGGREVEVNLDTAVSTRMATFTYTAPDPAATIAAAVWAMATSALTTVGSIGKKLADWVITAPVQILQGLAVTFSADLLTLTIDGVAGGKLTMKTGEAKTILMVVLDSTGKAVDLSAATLLLGVKKDKSETAYKFSKLDAAFDKTLAANGVVSVHVTAADTTLPEATYVGELKCAWAGPPEVVDKTADFSLQIKRAVTA